MDQLAIALDLGTSAFRAQALECRTGAVISTAITSRHPLPGANTIDHLHCALDIGMQRARAMITEAINELIGALHIPPAQVIRLALCGNPAQLSLFQGMEIRDLAWASSNKLEALGISPPLRDAARCSAEKIPGLALPPSCEIIIPPAICHEVGADALAMIVRSGMLEKDEISIAIDIGTNAEMALFDGTTLFTGSAAAGSAIEGQQICCGTLALPGALAGIIGEPPAFRAIVLDQEMLPVRGDLFDISQAGDGTWDLPAMGITGTGIIALVSEALDAGFIDLPHIRTADGRLHCGKDIFFTGADLREAGKAFAALRAGYICLCHRAGIRPGDIKTAYISGASGTCVEAAKAQRVGILPPCLSRVYQIGNTSLAMARELATEPQKLELLTMRARELKNSHSMFASSEVFKQLYILEFSHWTEGMPMDLYRDFLRRYHYPDLAPLSGSLEITRTVRRDIEDFGRKGLSIIRVLAGETAASWEECISCGKCVQECPEKALTISKSGHETLLTLTHSMCRGFVCRRCEHICPGKAFSLGSFFTGPRNNEKARGSRP